MTTPCESVSCCGGSAAGAAGTLSAALQFFTATQCLFTEPWPPDAHFRDNSWFDVIVVGGGTAGATVAARLADAFLTVLLVEAGGDPPQESIIPGMRSSMKATRYDWNFTTVNEHLVSQGLRGGSQRQPRGKMLGGSGSINDMVYSRGFPPDYHEWAAIAGESWNWTNVLEYFKKTEKLTDERIINNPELRKYHGFNGEIEVTGLNDTTHATKKFLDAFEELGFNMVNDMTNPHRIGAGRFSHTIRNGRRDSSLISLLNKVGSRWNVFVMKHTTVTKIITENGRATGIELLTNNNHTLTYNARKEVVISAGTFNTPKLLMLSGIGPKEHLKELGIKIVTDLPVGNNLHDHVMVLNFIAADPGTCNITDAQAHMEIIKYFYDQTGTYSRTDTMGVYIPTSKNSNLPHFAIYPTCMPVQSGFYKGCSSMLGFNDSICSALESINRNSELLSLAVVLLKPKSRGKVRLQSLDPMSDPLIYSGTFNNDEDIAGFPEALRVASSIVNTTYFKSKNARVVDPASLGLHRCVDEDEDKELKCVARNMATSAWHAVGTAAMGTVVDKELRVLGLRGLRVVDASVMPVVTRGNTNAPVIMIAERAADLIKRYLGF